MLVNVKGIFVPTGTTNPNDSYIIVDDKTYMNITGFPPVTYRELYGLRHYENLVEADAPINGNDFFEDKVNLYSYEMIYNDFIEFEDANYIDKMVYQLNRINRIANIDFTIRVIDIDENMSKNE